MNIQEWKQYLPAFRETTAQFYNGSFSQGDYKKFSGFYGSYAQRGGQARLKNYKRKNGIYSRYA